MTYVCSQLATRSLEPSFGLLFGDLLASLDVATTGAAIIVSAQDALINFSGLSSSCGQVGQVSRTR